MLFTTSVSSYAQSAKDPEETENTVISICKQVASNLAATKGISKPDMVAFKAYYIETIMWDKGQLFKNIEDDSINTTNTVAYVNLTVAKYAKFYDQYLKIPAINRTVHSAEAAISPPWPGACNPGCDNMDFASGTLAGWMGCYSNNTSSSSGFSYATPTCTGILGAVTTAAVYPTTGLPQLQITTATPDPVCAAAGIPGFLSQTCPLLSGSPNAVEIGDYNNPDYGVGILEQSFTVTKANCDFTYYYAVVLESPGGSHTHFQQPYFQVDMFDQNGNLIPFCGNYNVTADSASAQGNFKGVYYAADGDSCYVRPWTTVFVPLKKYLGQCVTIRVVTSDCALGGHFGYGYFCAKCAPLGIITSAPAICKNPITLTAPAGGASYAWTGPCIIGSPTAQTITCGCAGKYTVIIKSYIGALCADTLDTTIISSTGSILASFKSDTVCAGNPTNFTNLSAPAAGTTYDWNFGDPGSGPADSSKLTNPTHTYPTSGTYVVKLTAFNDSCSADTTINVVVNPGPIASFTSAPVCLNNPTTFTNTSTGGATGYKWNFGEPLSGPNDSSKLTSPTHTYSTCGKYLVTLIAKNGTCADTVKDSVTVNPLPTPNFTAAPVCQGSNTVLTDLSTINCGGTVTGWAWNFGDPTSGPNNTSTVQDPTHVFSDTGHFSVILTATSNNGCQNSVTLPVVIVPDPVAGFVSGPVCLGQPTSFTDTSKGHPTTWAWNFGDGGTSAVQDPTHTYGTAGTFVVKLVVSSGAGCTDSITENVVVNPPPVAAFTATTVCQGTATTFTNTSTGGATYLWTFGDGVGTSTLLNPTYTYGTAGSFNAKLVVTSANGCKDSVTVPVTVNPSPTGTITDGPVCLGSATSFSVNPALVGGTYNWNFGDGVGTSTVQNPTYTYTTANTFNVYVVLTSASGCFDTVKSTAVVNPNPVADFSATQVCQGHPTVFTDLSTVKTGAVSGWAWNFGDPGSGANNTSTVQNPTHVYSTCGTFNVLLTVTTSASCTHDTTITVTVNPVPVPNFTATSVCVGLATTFTDGSTIGCGGVINTYNWNFGDGKGTSIAQNPTYTYAAAGTYTVSLTVASSLGCDSTIKIPVTVYPLPVAAFTETSPCDGTPTQFTDASTGATAWAWNFGDGGTSTLTDPTHLYGTAGQYTVTEVVTSVNGCVDSTKNTITVYPNPVPGLKADTLRGCAPLCVNFTDLSTIVTTWGSSITSWSWSFGDSTAGSASQNPSHCYTKVGTFTVSLTVTTNNGCTETFTIPNYITTYPTPKANFSSAPNPTTMASPTIYFTDLSTGSPVSWSWVTFGDNTDSSKTTENTQHTYGDTGTYNVTLAIVNKWGCVDTITLPVDIQPMWTFYVPNAFTPNGDGMNDGFIGKGVGIIQYEMWIFDRWGMQLYHCTDMNSPWDGRVHTGTSSGQMCQEDTYVWLIDITDVFKNKHRYVGRVSIIK